MKAAESCLCGAATYEMDLPAERLVNCHCSRCRKATGTAHASNLVVRKDAFRWIVGAENVRRYDLPSARSFATCCCEKCGSPLPHHTRSGREVIVPAGSLDSDPQSTPELHICWSSRAAWHEHGDKIPMSEDLHPTQLPPVPNGG